MARRFMVRASRYRRRQAVEVRIKRQQGTSLCGRFACRECSHPVQLVLPGLSGRPGDTGSGLFGRADACIGWLDALVHEYTRNAHSGPPADHAAARYAGILLVSNTELGRRRTRQLEPGFVRRCRHFGLEPDPARAPRAPCTKTTLSHWPGRGAPQGARAYIRRFIGCR